ATANGRAWSPLVVFRRRLAGFGSLSPRCYCARASRPGGGEGGQGDDGLRAPVGVRNPDSCRDQAFLYDPAMLFLLSLIVRSLARLLASRRADGGAQELEILVLRHQLRVLRRKSGHPNLRRLDRVLLASASRVL